MSVYSDIVKRSYFDGSTGKALQNFADQSGRSALDMDCVRPNTIESCPHRNFIRCSTNWRHRDLRRNGHRKTSRSSLGVQDF